LAIDHAGPGPRGDRGTAHGQGEGVPAAVVLAPEPADEAPASSVRRSTVVGDGSAAEPRADAGGARAGASSTPAAGSGEDLDERLARDQRLFDQAATAYQSGVYDAAIQQFREHARLYPRSAFAGARDRLWTLALIRSDRRVEARQRIEALRKAHPTSPLLAEYDAALPPLPPERRP
jgi:TolA-binding protein